MSFDRRVAIETWGIFMNFLHVRATGAFSPKYYNVAYITLLRVVWSTMTAQLTIGTWKIKYSEWIVHRVVYMGSGWFLAMSEDSEIYFDLNSG